MAFTSNWQPARESSCLRMPPSGKSTRTLDVGRSGVHTFRREVKCDDEGKSGYSVHNIRLPSRFSLAASVEACRIEVSVVEVRLAGVLEEIFDELPDLGTDDRGIFFGMRSDFAFANRVRPEGASALRGLEVTGGRA